MTGTSNKTNQKQNTMDNKKKETPGRTQRQTKLDAASKITKQMTPTKLNKPKTQKNTTTKQTEKSTGATNKTNKSTTPKKSSKASMEDKSHNQIGSKTKNSKSTTPRKNKDIKLNNDTTPAKKKARTTTTPKSKNNDTTPAKKKKSKTITPKSKKSPVAKMRSPSKHNNRELTLIVTKDNQTKVFDDEEERDAFIESFEPLIKFKEIFKTKKELQLREKEIKEQLIDTIDEDDSDEDKKITSKALSGKKKEKYEQMKAALTKRDPQGKIIIYYYTDAYTNAAVLFFLEVDKNGRQIWWNKGEYWSELFPSYASVIPQNDKYIQDTIMSIKWAFRRDPNSGPNEILSTENKKKKQKEDGTIVWEPDGKKWNQSLCYGILDFTNMNFQNKEQESNWLQNKALETGQAFLNIRKNDLFINLIQEKMTVAQRGYAFDDGKTGIKYGSFYKGCSIEAEPIKQITDMVVRDNSNIIKTKLCQYKVPNFKKKYTIQQIEIKEEEDEELQQSEPDDQEEQSEPDDSENE